MPSPDASAPTRFCVQGREAVLVGARAGIKLGPWPEPLSRDRSPTEAMPRTAGLFLFGSQHDRDCLTAPTP